MCTVEGCNDPIRNKKRGWCNKHYLRWRIHGDINAFPSNRGVPDAERFWMKVQKGPGCWEWTGAKSRLGYGNFTTTNPSRRFWMAYRYAYTQIVGAIPEGAFLDHMCHNPSCVNPDHLRPSTHKQNMENLRGARRDSQTGVRGVIPTRSGKFEAWVGHNAKRHYLGTFSTIDEADEELDKLSAILIEGKIKHPRGH